VRVKVAYFSGTGGTALIAGPLFAGDRRRTRPPLLDRAFSRLLATLSERSKECRPQRASWQERDTIVSWAIR
jgi:hypothetical protein